MLDEIIRDMKDKGLIQVCPFGFRGQAKACFDFLDMMVNTEEYRPDADQWEYLTNGMNRDGGSR